MRHQQYALPALLELICRLKLWRVRPCRGPKRYFNRVDLAIHGLLPHDRTKRGGYVCLLVAVCFGGGVKLVRRIARCEDHGYDAPDNHMFFH